MINNLLKTKPYYVPHVDSDFLDIINIFVNFNKQKCSKSGHCSSTIAANSNEWLRGSMKYTI